MVLDDLPTAFIMVSPSSLELSELVLSPSSVNPMAVARYSPRESHLGGEVKVEEQEDEEEVKEEEGVEV